jgi:hypothetical protein
MPIRAGVAYFAIAFAVGFALGTLRATMIAPRLGETDAVLIELPVMLCVSWFACAWLVRRFVVAQEVLPRALMGGVALALLLVAELGLSVFMLQRTVVQHFALYGESSAQLGLAAQVLFALFPLLQVGFGRGSQRNTP